MIPDGKITEKILPPVLVQLLTTVLLPVIALIAIDLMVIYPLANSESINTSQAIILILAPKIAVLCWTCPKILRFTDAHYRKYGNSTIKTGLLAGLFLSVLAISVSAIDAVQFIIYSETANSITLESTPPEYQLSADMEKHEYSIQGTIDYGISNDFRILLEQNPGGKRVILASQGGAIYEARGLAVLIQKHRLDTHVNGECSSACTLAFIGGQRRTLAAKAKLGFHQYVMDYSNQHQVTPFHDPKKEQEKDSALMLKRGISNAFVDRVFDKLHQDIWYPDHASLVQAGVIHPLD